jgi:hypothetical protein
MTVAPAAAAVAASSVGSWKKTDVAFAPALLLALLLVDRAV